MTEKPEDGSDFIVTGDKDKLQPKEAEEEKKEVVRKTHFNLTSPSCFDCVNNVFRLRTPMEITRMRPSMCKMMTSWRQV